MKVRGYNVTVGLSHNELPAKLNQETGAFELIVKGNKLPEGFSVPDMEGRFTRHYSDSWTYLKKNLTKLEFAAAINLGMWARAYTNSLIPLGDKCTVADLSRVLEVGINRASRVAKKLYDVGVYGRFDVKEVDQEYKKYWVFNPYLSFNGKVIDNSMKNLFKNTLPAKVSRGEIV